MVRDGLPTWRGGVVVVALVIGVGSTLTSVPMLFAVPTYYGQFSDTGGLNLGDKVRIAGEPERETRAKREKDGIPVDDNTWNDICAAGAKLKVSRQTLDQLVNA